MEEVPNNVESNDFPIKIEEEEDSEKETKITEEVRKCQKNLWIFWKCQKYPLSINITELMRLICHILTLFIVLYARGIEAI